MPLTVMTYNILNGGGSRLDDLLGIVDARRPDLLALQELRGWDRAGARVTTRVAAALGMTAHLARATLGMPVAVLVRPPGRVLRHRVIRLPLHHAASIVEVATDRGPLTVTSAHLNPFSGSRRRHEAARLVRDTRPADGMALLMGDLNALDPGTDHTARLGGMHHLYRSRHVRRHLPGKADTRAIETLLAAGYRDLWTAAGGRGRPFTAPTTEGGGREFAHDGMRIDYILGSGPLAGLCTSCETLTGGTTESASDHYPVVATLDLSWPS
ncbi:endonuclease/exonuclease/phosphatase family protein [Catenuloplanes atrovinosus]|uniref:Endonuclease/exonuclease/phosphatase family metal-dependent hydrolase n=1 Tax=Catenuloplanes atrovinosus TaxID=137266 RepID=A0AAE3YJX1_9ACTN|nr:endonuclease/exonuclease/phosphatase family protein [Catenuloplanes atrovinosus]MDR7273744.1 endonuclease/exonuclease/phosphatase family metal-dependent hydrolase [Catenuloplanes atrovinosus]